MFHCINTLTLAGPMEEVLNSAFTVYSIIRPFDSFEISCLNILWKMEHLLLTLKSKCSISKNSNLT